MCVSACETLCFNKQGSRAHAEIQRFLGKAKATCKVIIKRVSKQGCRSTSGAATNQYNKHLVGEKASQDVVEELLEMWSKHLQATQSEQVYEMMSGPV